MNKKELSRIIGEMVIYEGTCGKNIFPLDLRLRIDKALNENLHPTTANVRFRWLKAIFTQITKATSYIRKHFRK
jgi:hypothetical protein